MLPLPGADKEGVIAFRDIKDCETMIATAKKYKKAIVIGGGLLGLEAARGLLNLNMEVSVVHIHPYLMDRQLDQPASLMLQRELEGQGMKFLLSKNTESILGRKRVKLAIYGRLGRGGGSRRHGGRHSAECRACQDQRDRVQSRNRH